MFVMSCRCHECGHEWEQEDQQMINEDRNWKKTGVWKAMPNVTILCPKCKTEYTDRAIYESRI